MDFCFKTGMACWKGWLVSFLTVAIVFFVYGMAFASEVIATWNPSDRATGYRIWFDDEDPIDVGPVTTYTQWVYKAGEHSISVTAYCPDPEDFNFRLESLKSEIVNFITKNKGDIDGSGSCNIQDFNHFRKYWMAN